MLYSADYRYVTGKRFRNGQLLPGQARLKFRPRPNASGPAKSTPSASQAGSLTAGGISPGAGLPDTPITQCTDWYNGVTGEYITTTGDCTVVLPPDAGEPIGLPPGGGGGGPSGPGDHWGGGGSGGGEGGNNPSGSSPLGNLNVTIGSLRPCATQIVKNIQTMANTSASTGGPIASLINAISINKNIKIIFNELPNLNLSGGVSRAQTSHVSGTNDYTITMNSDFLQGSDGATDLAIGSDVIHEILHVYMIDWADKRGIDPNTRLELLMDAFFDSSRPNAQHETMTTMVGHMGDALLQYYNSTFMSSGRLQDVSQSYCQALAWGGLQPTSSFQTHAARDPNWADQITAINQAERHPATVGAAMSGAAGALLTVPAPAGKQPCQ